MGVERVFLSLPASYFLCVLAILKTVLENSHQQLVLYVVLCVRVHHSPIKVGIVYAATAIAHRFIHGFRLSTVFPTGAGMFPQTSCCPVQ